jgi:hypothetical protein
MTGFKEPIGKINGDTPKGLNWSPSMESPMTFDTPQTTLKKLRLTGTVSKRIESPFENLDVFSSFKSQFGEYGTPCKRNQLEIDADFEDSQSLIKSKSKKLNFKITETNSSDLNLFKQLECNAEKKGVKRGGKKSVSDPKAIKESSKNMNEDLLDLPLTPKLKNNFNREITCLLRIEDLKNNTPKLSVKRKRIILPLCPNEDIIELDLFVKYHFFKRKVKVNQILHLRYRKYKKI